MAKKDKKTKVASSATHRKDGKKELKYIEGKIRISGKGFGYVKTDKFEERIEIVPELLNTALHNDKVRVKLLPSRMGEHSRGVVKKIIMRAKVGFAGTLTKKEEAYILIPSDFRMYADIIIPKTKLAGAKVGQKVFCIITKWKPKSLPQGEVIKILGKPREHEAEMQAIILEKGFQSDFPPPVEQESQTILKQAGDKSLHDLEIKKRSDFRNVVTFTIDPEDAKDFDDAISVRRLDNNKIEIGIHIADVSHYVRPGSALDIEAFRRSTSVYLVDRTIPMLPEALSNDICSLKQGEDRFTFSGVFILNNEGDVLEKQFNKTVINSDKRFSYEEAQKTLDRKEGPYFEELNILNQIAKTLRKKRFTSGAISIEKKEFKFELDSAGVPIKISKRFFGETNHLIEEFMLLCNREVAKHIADINKEKTHIFVYRVHEEPDQQKMADLRIFLARIGYPLKMKGGIIPSEEINILLKKLEHEEIKDTVQMAVVRTMARAIYSTKNIGHYGLAFKHYTHFTSPIRRYADLVVHRLLHDYLENKTVSKEKWHEYENIANFVSERSWDAKEAEWASIKYKQVEYMSSRIGDMYDGVITNLTEWGMYVEEVQTGCEGMVPLRTLKDDYYSLDKAEMALIGRKTGKKYRIGDKIRIKVTNADMDRQIIDYEIT